MVALDVQAMRRLFRLIWWAAVIAGIVWMLRDRLVPAPEPSHDAPPQYRVAPPPPPPPPAPDETAVAEAVAAEAVEDDLEAIKGVGPVYAARLAEAGITSFAGLAAADAGQLAEHVDVRAEQVADWIDQARGLAG